MKALFKIFALVLSFSAGTATLSAQPDYFANWPAGSSPQEVGKRLAEHFIPSPHQGTGTIFYGEVATWYGALTFAQLTHDNDLRDRLIKKFEPLMPGGVEAAKIPMRHHVDDNIFGVVPLESWHADQGSEVSSLRPVMGRQAMGEPNTRRSLR